MQRLPLLPQTAPFPEEQIASLNRVIGASTAEQRAWLSGFLAGYQAANDAAQPAAAAAPAAPPIARAPLTIFYATESGNAETLAGQAKKGAQRQGFAAKVVDMADATPELLARAGNALVIASTWGEGDPPQRAGEFYAALMGEAAPSLAGLRFAVLALGDSAYANFCETGKRIDARLEALGAIRAAARVDCDLDFAQPAAAWIGDALKELKPAELGDEGASVIRVDFVRPTPEADAAPVADAVFEAEITDKVNLNSSRSGKQTWHVELSLAGSGIRYEPGDALAVLPVNDPETVESVLSAVGLGGDAQLHQALATGHDVSTLSRKLADSYAALTGDAGLAALLQDEARRRDFLPGRQVIDLFEAFPHRLAPEQLLPLLRKLPPRLYSIASSLRAAEDEAHLLVGAVRYESQGRARRGVASLFLGERRRAGDTVQVQLRPNRHFRLPADTGPPVVMIGPGTGVAPFRAFLQERDAIGARGRNWLFFGDQHYTHDFLYQLEWQDLLQRGVLTRLDVAFSRDQPEKRYVQHAVWEQRAQLWAWLQEGAYLYVCGDATAMARDVHETLRRIAAEQGGRDAEGAEAYLAGLRREGRYLQDVY